MNGLNVYLFEIDDDKVCIDTCFECDVLWVQVSIEFLKKKDEQSYKSSKSNQSINVLGIRQSKSMAVESEKKKKKKKSDTN